MLLLRWFSFLLLVISIGMSAGAASAGKSLSKVEKPLNINRLSTSPDLTKRVGDVALVADSKTNSNIHNSIVEYAKLLGLFTVWYAFNAAYNVYNAYVKKDFKFPVTAATLQLLIGLLYAIPLWATGIRKFPKLTRDDFLKLLPIAFLNAFGHTVGVCAMFEVGGGSFTHVIKSSEPVASVILGLFINRVVPKPFTALSLVPITYGVAYASTLGQLSLSSMRSELTSRAAVFAMGSNVANTLRSIVRKNVLTPQFKERTHLDSSNEHALTTLLTSIIMIPVALALESPSDMSRTLNNLFSTSGSPFAMNLMICGLCFYFYNDMQNIVLGNLGPVPTAVGNTLKRVFIFGALYFFTSGETFPMAKIIGCAIAIAGCFGFAVFDSMKI